MCTPAARYARGTSEAVATRTARAQSQIRPPGQTICMRHIQVRLGRKRSIAAQGDGQAELLFAPAGFYATGSRKS